MELILSEKAQKYLNTIDDTIEYTEDNIVIKKSYVKNNNYLYASKSAIKYTILKDNKEWFTKTYEEGFCDRDGGIPDRIVEQIGVLDGAYSIIKHYNPVKISFEKDNIIYNNDSLYRGNINYTLDENLSFVFTYEPGIDGPKLKVYYSVDQDKVYIDYGGKHEIDMDGDIQEQTNDIINKTNDEIDIISEDIKTFVLEKLDGKDFEVESLNKLTDQIKRKNTISFTSSNIEEIVKAVENAKDSYLKFADYKSNKHKIDEEIKKLNELLEKYYDEYLINNEEYEKELSVLRRKYNLANK